jgi:Amt family ammonium transporter
MKSQATTREVEIMNSGDTAWLIISSALVLLMTPGLAFFYGGLVREADVVNTIKMSFISLAVIALEWALVGYSLSFAVGSPILGGTSWIGLSGVGGEPNPDYSATTPHLAFMTFQMMFAIITPALISGAIVGRMKFKVYVLFILLWGLIVYNPIAHWVWGVGGWLRQLGAIDFAGGAVVHISAGVSALVAAMILGPREAAHAENKTPHNVPFVILGASLLWFGWFGFNAGSALTAGGLASLAFVTTNLSAAAAVVTWVLIEIAFKHKPTGVGAAIAAVVGLVAITPAAGFVTPLASIAIGCIAAAVCYAAMRLLERSRIDDTLDVFACHGVGGVVGALLTGVFATTSVNPAGANGLLYGNPRLILLQGISVLATAGLAAVGTGAIMMALKFAVGLRPARLDEARGIDDIEHGGGAYALGTGSLIGAGSLTRKRTVIASRELNAPSTGLRQEA